MRILFVTPYVPSSIRIRPFHFIRQLGRDHDVTVLTVVPAGEASNLAELRSYCSDIHAIHLDSRQIARSCATAALFGVPLQAAYCRSPALSQKLASLLSTQRFDVVHVEHLRAAHLLFEVPASIPTVYDSVDSITLLLRRTLQDSHSWKQRLIAALEVGRTERYERRILRRADDIVVTSSDDASALRSLASESSIDVLPNGVDLDYFTPTQDRTEPQTIVISGKMSYHANVTAVLHFMRYILPLVRAEYPNVSLRIVGSGPPAEIRALRRDPRVEVTGYVSDVRVPIQHATVAVCPVTVKVGIQNKILEAMALGVPVVSTHTGALGLEAQPGRDLLVGHDATEVAVHIRKILGDATLRERLAQAGRRYVEAHHRWSDVGEQLQQIYASAGANRWNQPC